MWLSERTLGGLMLMRFGLGLLFGTAIGAIAAAEGRTIAVWFGVIAGFLVLVLGLLLVDEREFKEVERDDW